MAWSTACKLPGVSGSRDENGVITVVQPWWVPTIEEAFTIGDGFVFGLPETRRDFGTWEPDADPMGFQIGITYQGPDPDRPTEETFDMDTEFSEQPIETHWAIDTLINKYGGKFVDIGDGEKRLVMPKGLPRGWD